MCDFCPKCCTRNSACESCTNEAIAERDREIQCLNELILTLHNNAQAQRAQLLKEIDRLGEIAIEWNNGRPEQHYFMDEWFLAETRHNGIIVLKSLPEGQTYEYTTADHTYFSKEAVKRWALLPDSLWKREFAPSMTEKSYEKAFCWQPSLGPK